MNGARGRGAAELTVEQASDFLGLEPDTLKDWTKRGQVNPTSSRAPGEWRFAPVELERVRRELMYPGVSEEYGGYFLHAYTGISEDGRFGRCWYHVYASAADEQGDHRLLSLVMLVHHMYVHRRDRPLDAMALQEARQAVHAMIDAKGFKEGRLYRKTIGSEGIVRDSVEELRDNVYE